MVPSTRVPQEKVLFFYKVAKLHETIPTLPAISCAEKGYFVISSGKSIIWFDSETAWEMALPRELTELATA